MDIIFFIEIAQCLLKTPRLQCQWRRNESPGIGTSSEPAPAPQQARQQILMQNFPGL